MVDYNEAIRLAIEALEKQIPQKPERSGKFGVCPSCSRLIERYEQKHGNIEIPHCKWCGQAIDWSDDEPNCGAKMDEEDNT